MANEVFNSVIDAGDVLNIVAWDEFFTKCLPGLSSIDNLADSIINIANVGTSGEFQLDKGATGNINANDPIFKFQPMQTADIGKAFKGGIFKSQN